MLYKVESRLPIDPAELLYVVKEVLPFISDEAATAYMCLLSLSHTDDRWPSQSVEGELTSGTKYHSRSILTDAQEIEQEFLSFVQERFGADIRTGFAELEQRRLVHLCRDEDDGTVDIHLIISVNSEVKKEEENVINTYQRIQKQRLFGDETKEKAFSSSATKISD